MKNNLLVILMLAVITAWGSAPESFSMDIKPSPKKTPVTKPVSQTLKISGEVVAFNTQNSTIIISKNRVPLVISIDKNTLFRKAGKDIKSTAVKVGDFVTVAYETKKGLNIAKTVTLQAKASPQTPKKK